MLTRRWNRVESLFHAALDVSPAARDAFVTCQADDATVACEVRRLLAHHADDPAFIEPPTTHALAQLRDEDLAHPLIGRRIGGYVVQRLIGAGGQGMVFEAQQEALGRRVALKLISGAAIPGALERRMFEREVRTLARLQHPGIAAIHESGQSDEGQPYFAMEFVDGQPLTTFARQHAMPIRQRIDMFVLVCEAVSYAHQRGVIHRDLKPSNILVVQEGTEARRHEGTKGGEDSESLRAFVPSCLRACPKILDFGLARFLDGDGGPRTETGRIQGTLPYLSPEQARGDTAHIDARSDVYCLGVLLYELLADRLPFDVEQDGPSDALRKICEQSPARLAHPTPPRQGVGSAPNGRTSSTSASAPLQVAQSPTSSAGARSSSTRRFNRDVEAIVFKALEKEPTRRYQSAAALADDLRRYLEGQPVLARLPSATYQLRKLAARHKLPVALTATLLAFLVLFAGFATVQAWRLSEQRNEAWKARQAAVAESLRTKGEAQRATRVARFLESLLTRADSMTTPNQPMSARDVIDMAVRRLSSDLWDDRPTAAKLRVVLARAYAGVGAPQESEAMLWQALDELRDVYGHDHEDWLDALRTLARQKMTRYELADARNLVDQASEMAARLYGDASPAAVETLHVRAELARLSGDYSVAEAIYRDALDHPPDTYGCPLMNATVAMEDLGGLYVEMADFEQAEPLLQEALRLRRTVLGDNNVWVSESYEALGRLCLRRGQPQAAERCFTRACAICEQCPGTERANLAYLLGEVGEAQQMDGRLGDAEASFRASIELAQQHLPARHPFRVRAEGRLGDCLTACGQGDEALPYLLTRYYGLHWLLGDEHPETAAALAAIQARGSVPLPSQSVAGRL